LQINPIGAVLPVKKFKFKKQAGILSLNYNSVITRPQHQADESNFIELSSIANYSTVKVLETPSAPH
jgi:hypothetical protein